MKKDVCFFCNFEYCNHCCRDIKHPVYVDADDTCKHFEKFTKDHYETLKGLFRHRVY